MLLIITGIIVSYLLGSIPTAYIFGRVLKGIDIRKFGSGNVGATNAMRVLGALPAIAVLLIDIFKGLAAVLLVGNFVSQRTDYLPHEALRMIFGACAIAGHSWTVFLGFRGGKGIATSFGVLIALAIKIPPLRLILALLSVTWLVTFAITRIVSVASILSAALLPIYMLLFRQPPMIVISITILSIFVILRHKSNLIRIFRGEERPIRFKKP